MPERFASQMTSWGEPKVSVRVDFYLEFVGVLRPPKTFNKNSVDHVNTSISLIPVNIFVAKLPEYGPQISLAVRQRHV